MNQSNRRMARARQIQVLQANPDASALKIAGRENVTLRNPNNRDFLMGNTRMYRAVDGQMRVAVDNPNDDNKLSRGPVRELGNPFIFDAGKLAGWPASIELDISHDMTLIARLSANPNQRSETSSAASLFDLQPTTAAVGSGCPLGGVCVVGRLQSGHKGCTSDWYFNMNVGAEHRLAFNASSAKFSPIVVPKYFQPDDTATTVRVYTTTAGNPLDASTWNQPTPSLLAATLSTVPSQAAAFTRQGICHAWFGQGAAEVDVASRSHRKFFGSLRASATAYGTATIVPVAYGATHVALNASALRSSVAAPLQFFQVRRGDYSVGAPIGSTYIGPYQSFGQTAAGSAVVPLVDNVEFLAITAPAAFAGNDILFEVCYYLGS